MTIPKVLTLLGWIVVLVPVSVVVAGQAGLLSGTPPSNLGVTDGRLKPPSKTPNSVSSQARLHTGHPRAEEAQIDPLTFQGDGRVAMKRLSLTLASVPRLAIVVQEPTYLRAEARSRLLRFTDDVEFYLDEGANVIHVRSSSRLGRKDFGVNRERVEAIRSLFAKT